VKQRKEEDSNTLEKWKTKCQEVKASKRRRDMQHAQSQNEIKNDKAVEKRKKEESF